MKFCPLQLNYFRADQGAYSKVTSDERKKGQITLTEGAGEYGVALQAVGRKNIPRRAAQERPISIYVRRRDGSEGAADLTINFPKSGRNELRIYRKANAGFNYEAGDVCFLFIREERLYVGAMSEVAWQAIGRLDSEDDRYIELAEEALTLVPDPKRVQGLRYLRDPALAHQRFEAANFKCEIDPSHELFDARVSGRPFLEPHHLIPVSLQDQFQRRALDHQDNIFALCPRCHRAVHHATIPVVSEIVNALLGRRPDVCNRLELTPPDVLRLYNCEKITR